MTGLPLSWPLHALMSWALFGLLLRVDAPQGLATAAAVALCAVLSVVGSTLWRRLIIASGFPLSLAASGFASAMPAWGWLWPLALIALVYPLKTWRDAPLFPTPAGALRGLSVLAPLAPGARILDAGCGLGDGLHALRGEYPEATLHGLERSWPLRILCAWRCRFATVRRGDIRAADWSGYDLVYVFQRPESMDRAAEKAMREMGPGAWLVSLEFDVPGLAAPKVIECADGRGLWLYQLPFNDRLRRSTPARRR